MNVVNRPTGDLIPYEKNAKKHDRRQIANVAESIRQYGFVQPVVIDQNGVIVIGHCRVLAAKKLGMAEVPCVLVDDLTPEQVNALDRGQQGERVSVGSGASGGGAAGAGFVGV